MTLLGFLTACAAMLGPLAHIPSLRRMIAGRTADGMTVTLCGLGLFAYGTWMGLAFGLGPFMVLVVVLSVLLCALQAFLTARFTRVPLMRLLPWATLSGLSLLVALRWEWVALGYIVAIDLWWYLRAVRDVRRSTAAAAVSVWGWVLLLLANVAWVVEALSYGRIALAAQCSILAVASLAGGVSTLVVQRRALVPANAYAV
jgi:hypothetical protein